MWEGGQLSTYTHLSACMMGTCIWMCIWISDTHLFGLCLNACPDEYMGACLNIYCSSGSVSSLAFMCECVLQAYAGVHASVRLCVLCGVCVCTVCVLCAVWGVCVLELNTYLSLQVCGGCCVHTCVVRVDARTVCACVHGCTTTYPFLSSSISNRVSLVCRAEFLCVFVHVSV